ncbi:MAG: M23 family metallopeptidase [Patescibacteria group bacterium]
MRKWNAFRRDLGQYVLAWGNFLYKRLYKWFAGFEWIKKLMAQVLYKQRGRFTRPFMHTAMGGLVALAVTLAPILASTFPGIDPALAQEEDPVISVMDAGASETAWTASDKVRDKTLEYEVQPGDTVSAVAEKYGVSADTIRWENGMTSANQIKPGQKLKILPVSGVRHKVARGETVYSIAKKYSANAQAIVDFPFNTFSDNESFALDVGQDLIVPDGKKPNEVQWSPTQNVARRTPDAGAVSATGQFAWPMGGVITQNFAWYHRGLDIATAHGTPIVAADSGRVTTAGWPDNGGYGNRVVIDHGNGYTTLYAHLSKVYVTAGQTVKRGDTLGLEGSTGRSTGPHLHFEIHKNGVFVSPLQHLK